MKRKSIKKITINKKTIVVFLIILGIFWLFVYIINKPKNYKSSYNVNKYKVVEEYNKKNSSYLFKIMINKIEYSYLFNEDYVSKRHLINKIDVIDNNDNTCILPKSNYIDFYPICYKDGYLSLNLVDNNLKYKFKKNNAKYSEYKKVKIYNLYDKNYLVYNYNGFLFIGNNNKSIKLDTNNEYSLDNLYKTNDYLIVPIIDNYYISEFIFINGINSKTYKLKVGTDISKDIRYLGEYKNNLYFIDNKEEKEYLINIKKRKLEELEDPVIVRDNKIIVTTIEDIIKKNLSFMNVNNSFVVENNTLYKKNNNIKIKVSDKEIEKVVSISDYDVSYISKGILYVYNMYDGEIKLLENFEWNFNRDNQVYIFNNK